MQRNGWIDKAKISSISELLYPFLQSEFFLKFAQRNIANTISQILDVLISEGVLIDLGDGVIGSPQSNSAHYQQLIVLASPAQQSLERYFMALTLLSEQGSNRLNSEQTVNLCYVLGQRISLLYGDDLPDMFDKALFTSFLDTLKRLDYIQINDGLISFDERIDNIAKHARFVLNPDMMDLLHHTASLNDDEIEMVLAQTAKRKFGLK